ncbi:interferon-inducible GTPase 5-like [Mauremys reevesii]|uniref:interferon-inducible GTPase 5-like n=1 Tax=Mauremys reevesii TaxID=260615 RepID=UPI00193F8F35|nr:interferon-inducible GTPase 5-like [Mauremys reevesii]XP_039368706.1 interferon-inducible GTPase 5-like [Mauremys reevesii]
MAAPASLDDAFLRELRTRYEAQDPGTAATRLQALVDSVNALKADVAVVGRRGAGVTTLIHALLGERPGLDDPQAFFQQAPEPPGQPAGYPHPSFPNLALWDLPGFQEPEKPGDYTKRLGDLGRFGCLVLVVAEGSPADPLLRLLKAFQQKRKPYYVVRTKVDLDLHTAKRRFRARYSSAEALALARNGVAEALARNGLDTTRVFLVSALETDRHQFNQFQDKLEEELIQLKRAHDGELEDLRAVSPRKIQELYQACAMGGLAEVPAIIRSALEEPSQIRLDVAVLGEAGSGKSALVNALRGVGCGEPEAAPTGVTATTRKATAYAHPTVPGLYLWDLPGVGLTEEDMGRLDLSRYDFFLLTASERYRHAQSRLARAVSAAGKRFFFVRTKVDVDAQPGPEPGPVEEIRSSCVDALQKDGVGSPRVFLVSSLLREDYDLPALRAALESDAPALKREALEKAIPVALGRLVRRTSKALMKDVWGKTLESCLYWAEKPGPDVATSLIDTVSAFSIQLGLDEESLAQVAKATGKPAGLLQAEIQSPWVKRPDPEQVLKQITKPVPFSSRMWSLVPYWGRGAEGQPEISLEATYRVLTQALAEMTEDAERMLRRAYAKE